MSGSIIPKQHRRDPIGLRKNLRKLASQKFGRTSSPTFGVVTLVDLTASRLVWTNASKQLVSKDLIDLVAGTENRVTISDDGDGSITVSGPQDMHDGASPTFVTTDLTGVTDGNVPYMATAAAGFTDSPISVNAGVTSIGGASDYVKMGTGGLLTLVGAAGLTYGFIYNTNTTIATALTLQNTWYRSYDAANAWTSGTFKDMTLGDGYIQVDTAGHYLAIWSASIDFSAAPGSAQQVEGGFMVDPNTGTYAAEAGGSAHRTIANSTDTGNFCSFAVLDLGASYKVGLGFNNNTSAGKTIHNEHASLILIQIAGT